MVLHMTSDASAQPTVKKSESPPDPSAICSACGKYTEKISRCGRCFATRYCSKECQRAHWAVHKQSCKPIEQQVKPKEHHRMGNCYEEIERLWKDITKNRSSLEVMDSSEASLLVYHAEQIQFQHERLESEISSVLQSLTKTLKRLNIALPERKRVRHKSLTQLKSKENIRSLIERCSSSDLNVQLESTKECRKLLSDQNPPIKELVEMGLVPIFVQFLEENKNSKLQFEAAWVLTNICSGTSEQTQEVVSCNAVPLLIRLLSSKDEELVEQCVWVLGNIAADSPVCRDILLDAGVVEAMIPLMDSRRLTMLKNISWTMSNLCNGVQQNHWPKILKSLPKFSRLVYYNDEEILKDVCWSLSCISSGTKDRIQSIIELDPSICKRLIDLLVNPSPSVQHAALVTVGNIVTGDDEQTQVLINYNILSRLRRLLSHSKKSVLKDTCFTISNIAAGNQNQIKAIIESKLIPALVLLFSSTQKLEIKVEATWALANALSNGSDEQISYLVNQGCVKCLCELLGQYDSNTIDAVLEGLENVLRVGDNLMKNSPRRTNIYTERLRQQIGNNLVNLQLTEPVSLNKLNHIKAKLGLM